MHLYMYNVHIFTPHTPKSAPMCFTFLTFLLLLVVGRIGEKYDQANEEWTAAHNQGLVLKKEICAHFKSSASCFKDIYTIANTICDYIKIVFSAAALRKDQVSEKLLRETPHFLIRLILAFLGRHAAFSLGNKYELFCLSSQF